MRTQSWGPTDTSEKSCSEDDISRVCYTSLTLPLPCALSTPLPGFLPADPGESSSVHGAPEGKEESSISWRDEGGVYLVIQEVYEDGAVENTLHYPAETLNKGLGRCISGQ